MVGRDFQLPFAPSLGPTRLPIKWVPGLFPGIKRSGRGVIHLPASSAEVKETVELYLYFLSRPSWPVLGRTFFICSRLVVLCLGINAFLLVDRLFYATSRYVIELNYVHLEFSTLFCTYDSDGPKRAVEGRYNGNEISESRENKLHINFINYVVANYIYMHIQFVPLSKHIPSRL